MPGRITHYITDNAIKIGLRWFALILLISFIGRFAVHFHDHWMWYSRLIASAICFGLSATIQTVKTPPTKP